MADLANLRIAVDSREVVQAEKDLNSFGQAGNRAEQATDGLANSSRGLSGAMAALTAAFAAIGLDRVIQQARDFSTAMAEVSTLINPAVVSMEQLNAVALDQAAQFGSAPITQAQALYKIISAGATSAAEANEILTAANRLAIGGVTDVATAAAGLTGAMNAYGAAAGSATDVSDAMFVAVSAGQTKIGELSAALGSVAPLAAQLGVPFDELVAATAALTKGSMSTSEAMTGLRAIFATVASPTQEAADLAAQLGIEFNAAALETKGLAGFMQDLVAKTGGSQEQMAKLFGGVEALVPALALSGEAGDDLANIMLDMAEKAGSTEEAFNLMAQSAGFKIDVLMSKIQVEAIKLGNAFLSVLIPAIDFINKNFNLLSGLLVTAAAGFAAYKTQVALAIAINNPFIATVLTVTSKIGIMAGVQVVAARATAALSSSMRALTATMMANPFVAVATAITAVIALLYSYRDANVQVGGETIRLGDIFLGVWQLISNAISVVQNAFTNGWANAFNSVSPALRSFGQFFDNVFTYVGNVVRNQINRWVGLFVGLSRAITAIFTDEGVGDAFRSALSVDYVGAFGRAIGSSIVGLANLGRASRGASAETVQLTRATSELPSAINELTPAVAGLTEATEAQSRADEAANNERQQAIQSAREYIESLQQATREIGKNAIELKEMEISARAAAAPTAELAEQTRRYGAALIEAMRGDMIGGAERELRNLNRQMEHQIELIGMTAEERDAATRAFEDETLVAEMAEKGITRGNEALEEYLRLRRELAQGESTFAREAADIERMANNLETAAGMFGQSRIGSVLQGVLNLEVKFKDGETRKVSEAIARTFPQMAQFIGQAVAGAQVGQQVNNLLGAVGIRSSGAGSQLGGAVGMMFGGPIGAIGGAIVGGVLGGMLKGTPRAAATIEVAGGNALMSAVSGSKKLQGVASGLANGLIKGLGDVAETLGGELGGAVRLSIGQRKDKFTVDVTGQGRTKGVPTFNTEAEAIAFAMRHAIAQGAITGVSAGAQALIRASGDLNEQVQKALKFDEVFRDLLKETDPLQAKLNELNLEMQRLTKIFDEAGASAQDRAQLEELFSIRRQKAIFEANRDRRELEIELMEAQGREAEALAASRALELEAMDASLRGLKEQIFAAQDAAAAQRELADAQKEAARQMAQEAEEAARLTAARRSLEVELLEALGDTNGALAMRRQLELEATEVSLRGLRQQIFAAEDAAAAQRQMAEAQEAAQQRVSNAQDVLRQAYERESSTLIETAKRFRSLGDALRSVSGSISGMISGGAASADLRGAFLRTAAAARLGDVAALEALPNLASELAQSVTETAPDRLSMIRELMAIKNETEMAALVTDRQASIAEQQLDAITQQTMQLISINETMVTVAEAARQLVALSGGTPAPIGSTASVQQAAVYDANQSPLFANNDNTRNELSALRDEMKIALFQIAKNTGKASDQLARWDGEGLPEARGY